MPYDRNHRDFQAENWWATVSGAGTPDAAEATWADDYTRHRTTMSPTYSGVDDLIGRKESILDVNP
jgi:hypothetical protein